MIYPLVVYQRQRLEAIFRAHPSSWFTGQELASALGYPKRGTGPIAASLNRLVQWGLVERQYIGGRLMFRLRPGNGLPDNTRDIPEGLVPQLAKDGNWPLEPAEETPKDG